VEEEAELPVFLEDRRVHRQPVSLDNSLGRRIGDWVYVISAMTGLQR
jgi:hypothetical protein